MKVGQKVWWWAQGNGWYNAREGTIVKVLAPYEQPSRKEFPDFWKGCHRPGRGRSKESYIVREQRGRGATRDFWPLAHKLMTRKPDPKDKPLGREAQLRFL